MSSRQRIADSKLPLLVAILTIGGIVRIGLAIGAGFPLGDGGLFASMIDDIRGAAFELPDFTSYNGGDIPFAYPPLGLYLGALLPLAPLTTLQWLPPILATLCIVPIYVAGTSIGTRTTGLTAAAFFALAPFGWFWLVQGGGLTRALAILLALSAVAAALHGRAVVAGLLGGLTALSHPETAIFAAVAVAAILAVDRAWRALLLAGVVAAAVVLPWLTLVVSQHGPDPFLSALGARSVHPLGAVLSISGGRPGVLDLAAAVGLVGLAASGVGWLYGAATLTALLLTTSVETHLAPLMALGTGASLARHRVPTTVAAAFAVLLLIGAGVPIGNPQPLGADDRAAMAWVRQQTPDDARFAVLSDEIWSLADEAEWFPHLAGRTSVMTMQGREWLPQWEELDEQRRRLLACIDRSCVDDWLEQYEANYVYLADDCCARLAALLIDEWVRRDGSAAIYRIALTR